MVLKPSYIGQSNMVVIYRDGVIIYVGGSHPNFMEAKAEENARLIQEGKIVNESDLHPDLYTEDELRLAYELEAERKITKESKTKKKTKTKAPKGIKLNNRHYDT